MNYRYVFNALVLIATASFQFEAKAADNVTKKLVGVNRPSPYTPQTFDANQLSLPPGYRGVDHNKFLRLFESKVKNFRKDDFETTQQFEMRRLMPGDSLAPIFITALYAFQIKSLELKYDADKQYYVAANHYSCEKTFYEGDRYFVECDLGKLTRTSERYIGQNAFGASARVDSYSGTDLIVALNPRGRFVNSDVFEQDRFVRPEAQSLFQWKNAFPYPLEKARALRGLEVRALLVGNVSEARVVEGKVLHKEPTIDSASRLLIVKKALPFVPKILIYYVVQTGEILKSQNF